MLFTIFQFKMEGDKNLGLIRSIMSLIDGIFCTNIIVHGLLMCDFLSKLSHYSLFLSPVVCHQQHGIHIISLSYQLTYEDCQRQKPNQQSESEIIHIRKYKEMLLSEQLMHLGDVHYAAKIVIALQEVKSASQQYYHIYREKWQSSTEPSK